MSLPPFGALRERERPNRGSRPGTGPDVGCEHMMAVKPVFRTQRHHYDDVCMTIGSERNTILSGGGEMGRLMRSIDWSTTGVGPVETWPRACAPP